MRRRPHTPALFSGPVHVRAAAKWLLHEAVLQSAEIVQRLVETVKLKRSPFVDHSIGLLALPHCTETLQDLGQGDFTTHTRGPAIDKIETLLTAPQSDAPRSASGSGGL